MATMRTGLVTAAAFTDWILRHRWLVIAICLLAGGAASLGARNLVISTDYRIYFSDENPQLRALEALEDTYGHVDNVLFFVEAREGTLFTPAKLRAIADLTEAAWQLPFSTRVDSLTNYQTSHADGDALTVADMVPAPQELGAAEARAVGERALADPELRDYIVAGDGQSTVVAVTFHLPEGEDSAVEAAAAADRLARRMEAAHPGLAIGITGTVILDREFSRAALLDFATIYPLMGVLLFLTMMVVFRSALGASAAMAVVFLSSATAMGLAGWSGIRLTSPSGAAAVIVLIIAIADSIHIFITASSAIGRGQTKRDAIVESMRLNAGPVFLTSLTTAIGFLSLNWSDAPPFRHFGNIAAVGTLAAWIYSMLLLPCFLSLLPPAALARAMQGRGAITALTDWVLGHRRAILAGTALLLLGAAGALTQLRIDDSFIRYFSKDTQFRQDAEHMQAALPGVLAIDFSVPSATGSVADPDYLRRLAAFTDWLDAQPEVGHVTSIAPVMRRLNRNMHGDDPEFDRLPHSGELAAQYLLLYELSLPYGLTLDNQIDIGQSASRATALLHDVTTAQIRDLKARAEDWAGSHFPREGPAPVVEGTGISVIFTYLTLRNVESMLQGTAVAFVLISLCLVLALKSVKLGLLSLGINILPVVLGFGAWALLAGRIGIYASFVAPAALGLIVDFTVHFLSKYLRARRDEGASPVAAVRYAYSMVGAALWCSSAILLVGFCALMLSDFLPNGFFGLMTALVIACALIVDFLVLPLVLLRIDKEETSDA